MKVIIAGGREFSSYRFVEEKCNDALRSIILAGEEIEVISGRCSTGKWTWMTRDGIDVYGVDGLAERYATEMKEQGLNFEINTFPADWKKYGRAAGPIRNKQMAEYADSLIAFWDGKSKVTRNMIKLASENNLLIQVYKY